LCRLNNSVKPTIAKNYIANSTKRLSINKISKPTLTIFTEQTVVRESNRKNKYKDDVRTSFLSTSNYVHKLAYAAGYWVLTY